MGNKAWFFFLFWWQFWIAWFCWQNVFSQAMFWILTNSKYCQIYEIPTDTDCFSSFIKFVNFWKLNAWVVRQLWQLFWCFFKLLQTKLRVTIILLIIITITTIIIIGFRVTQSHPSFPFLTFQQVALNMSACLNTLDCCHVIGWYLNYWTVVSVYGK